MLGPPDLTPGYQGSALSAAKSELLIQGEDGRIRECNTYGEDPRASAG
jgi:hypothetical protein